MMLNWLAKIEGKGAVEDAGSRLPFLYKPVT